MFNLGIAYTAGAGATMIPSIRVNGAQRRGSRTRNPFSGAPQRMEFLWIVKLNAGDIVQPFYVGTSMGFYGNPNPTTEVISTFEGAKL